MTFAPYATAADLSDWLRPDPIPDNAPKLLRAATFVVAEAANRNPYGEPPTGDDVAPLRDAACAQAAAWKTLGIDPDALGIDGPTPVKKTSMLGADVEYDTKASVEARSQAARELAPQAESILEAAGLLWMPTASGDTSGALATYGLAGPANPRMSTRFANHVDAWWLL